MFKDLLINIWTIVYDNDQNKMYSFTDFDKAVASIEGSIRCYIDDDEDYEQTVELVIDFIHMHASDACIPIKFGNLNMIMFKWSLDYTTNIHQLLSESFDKIKDEVFRSRIKALFNSTN